jgi:D-alanine-D-alanine ligase
MAAVIDPADRPFPTNQIRDLSGWAERSAGQLTVALVYGGVSDEDQFYIAKSPPEQLSVTALSAALTELGMRFSVLDPCRPVRTPTSETTIQENTFGVFSRL